MNRKITVPYCPACSPEILYTGTADGGVEFGKRRCGKRDNDGSQRRIKP